MYLVFSTLMRNLPNDTDIEQIKKQVEDMFIKEFGNDKEIVVYEIYGDRETWRK